MSEYYPILHHEPLIAGTKFCSPQHLPEVVKLDSPAIDSLTDFEQVKPITTRPHTLISEALTTMRLMQVRQLLVVENDHSVVGVIQARDIQGKKPVEYGEQNRIPFSEISVGMIMRPCRDTHVVHFESLSNARVGHVLQTMRELGEPYLLVVEHKDNNPQPIARGLFAISDLSRQLDQDINVLLGEAHSLLELKDKLK